MAVLSYDAPYLLEDAIKNVGYDAEKIKNYFYSIKNYEGTSGIISFDKNGDSLGLKFNVFEAQDGKSIKI